MCSHVYTFMCGEQRLIPGIFLNIQLVTKAGHLAVSLELANLPSSARQLAPGSPVSAAGKQTGSPTCLIFHKSARDQTLVLILAQVLCHLSHGSNQHPGCFFFSFVSVVCFAL